MICTAMHAACQFWATRRTVVSALYTLSCLYSRSLHRKEKNAVVDLRTCALSLCSGLCACLIDVQGAAHMDEDLRQAPYLCPVCLRKLLQATGTSAHDHYSSLLAFCQLPARAGEPLFAGYAAWIQQRLETISRSVGVTASDASARGGVGDGAGASADVGISGDVTGSAVVSAAKAGASSRRKRGRE